MKTMLASLAILSLIGQLSQAQETAQQKLEKISSAYMDEVKTAERAYRNAFASVLDQSTKIEVFLLDPGLEKGRLKDDLTALDPFAHLEANEFPILPYKQICKILVSKILSKDEVTQLLPSLKATISGDSDVRAACHDPIHGIRIWLGEELIFQTSICYGCQNFYFKYPFGKASWIGLSEPAFKTTMEKLMPIPPKTEPKGKKPKPNKK